MRHAPQEVALDRRHPIQLFRLCPELFDEQRVLHGDRGVLTKQAQQLALCPRRCRASLPGCQQARTQLFAGRHLHGHEGPPRALAVAHCGNRVFVGLHGCGPTRHLGHRRRAIGRIAPVDAPRQGGLAWRAQDRKGPGRIVGDRGRGLHRRPGDLLDASLDG